MHEFCATFTKLSPVQRMVQGSIESRARQTFCSECTHASMWH